MAEKAIAGLIEQDENVRTKLDESLAYAVANMKLIKVLIVGAAGGKGVLVDLKTQQRIYFTDSRFDLGGGWGARSFKILLAISSQQVLDELKGD